LSEDSSASAPFRWRWKHWFRPVDPTVEGVVRSAHRAILWVACPALFGFALVANSLDHPNASLVALVLLLAGIAQTGLAFWWWRHPPKHGNRAAAISIVIVQLAVVSVMIIFPYPLVATLQVIVAVAVAYFLMDLRWMLSVQAFGVACWLAVMGLREPTLQWQLSGIITLAGYTAAAAFYRGRVISMNRIRQLTHESQGLDAEAQRSAQALLASESRLRNAQRIAHVGSFEWDLESNELHWSDEHYRIFGWEPGEISIDDTLFIEKVHPDDRDAMLHALRETRRHGAALEIEYRIVRADGEERVLFGRGETTRDESGKPILHSGTCLDFTEQYRVEAALRESESRLKAILTAMDADRAVIVTREGIFESTLHELPNEKSHDGVRTKEIVGRSIHEFLPGEAGDQMSAAVEGIYAMGGRSELEVSVDSADGTLHFDISLRTLRSTSGGIESVLAIVRDVTQRKADALTLRQAQRLESLGVLAGGVAHDFNNLLVGVLGNAETALDKIGATSPLRSELKDIVRASTRAAELTRELLAYAGTAKLEAEPVDVPALVEEIAQLVGPGLVDGVTIEVDRRPESAWVHADATQIRQVVMNFIVNAADAMEGVDGRIRVRADTMYMDRLALERFTIRETLAPGEYARVEVSDHGVGMDRQTLDLIFDPFFTTKFQGRGLGLASTLGIVRAHGGAIHVESEVGRGSTFTMLLPSISPALTKPSEPEPDAHAGNATILVVDDEDVVRVTARRMLELRGYHVLNASSGSRAVEMIRRGNAVDLALVDLTMPEMDGEQTFVALRALAPDLPVVFMSGHSREDMGLRVAGKDLTSHITKPFRMNVLSETIAALLAPRK